MRLSTWCMIVLHLIVWCVLLGAAMAMVQSPQKSPTEAAWRPEKACPAPDPPKCFMRWAPSFGRGKLETESEDITPDDVIVMPRCYAVDGRSYDGPCIDGYEKIVRSMPAVIDSAGR